MLMHTIAESATIGWQERAPGGSPGPFPATQKFQKQYVDKACRSLSGVPCPLPINVDAYYCTQCSHAAYYSVDGSCSSNHFLISPAYSLIIRSRAPPNNQWVDIPACTTAPQTHWRDSESCNKHTNSHMPPMGIFLGPCLWEFWENHLGTISGRRNTWRLSQAGEPLGSCLRKENHLGTVSGPMLGPKLINTTIINPQTVWESMVQDLQGRGSSPNTQNSPL
jgi:hypothetical protein